MKKTLIILCVLLLTGCSARFAYNNISWLVHWYIDDYVELNDSQEDQFDAMLETWMTWHKTEELPKYKAQLQAIINDIKSQDINPAKFEAHRQKMRGHWERARAYVANDIVTLGRTLDQDQVIYLLAALEKENKEDEEEMLEKQSQRAEKREKRWIKRNQKNIKNWLGTLNPEQEKLILSFRERFETTGFLWLEYKRDYQNALRQVFAMPTRDEEFDALLYDLIVNPEQHRSEAFNIANDNNIVASSEYFLGLLSLSTAKQRNILIDEIESFITDIEAVQK